MASLFNKPEKLSDNMGILITRSIYTAIDAGQSEIVQTLVNFITKMLIESFNKNINSYNQFIGIPSYYYFKGYTSGKYPELSTNASQTFTDLIRFLCVNGIEKSVSISELKTINQFIYLTYKGYSQLFYQIIQNDDFKSYAKAIEKYRIAFIYDNLSYPSFLTKEAKVQEDFYEKFHTEIQEYRKIAAYHRRTKFAILSWLWFLYDNDQIGKVDLIKYSELISIERVKSSDLIEDLIFYNTFDIDFFGWNSWDYIERKEFVVYSPPQPQDWLTFGFALFCLRQFCLYNIDYDIINDNELFRWLPEKLNKSYEKILVEKEKWIDILWPNKELQPNTETLENNILKILDPFYKLKRREERNRVNIIAKQSLSIDKINSFKQGNFEAFSRNSSIRDALYSFKNIELVEEINDSNKEIISIKTSFTEAKMMFVDEGHQIIYGTNDLGSLIARKVDERFIRLVSEVKNHKKSDNINTAIEDSINSIRNKGFEPNLIIIDPQLAYTSQGLSYSKKFIPSGNTKGDKNSIFNVGYYNDIPVISVFSQRFDHNILVCDFIKSFKAEELSHKELFGNVLDIEVNSISEDEAMNIYRSNPKKWEKTKDGISINEVEALEIIKLDIQIDIKYEILFKIIDNQAFELIRIIQKSGSNE
jgi:hypothetical protein